MILSISGKPFSGSRSRIVRPSKHRILLHIMTLLLLSELLILGCGENLWLSGKSANDLELVGTWYMPSYSAAMTISNSKAVMGEITEDVIQYDNDANTMIVFWTNNPMLTGCYQKWHWLSDPGDSVMVDAYQGVATLAEAKIDTIVVYANQVMIRTGGSGASGDDGESGESTADGTFYATGTITGEAVTIASQGISVYTFSDDKGMKVRIGARQGDTKHFIEFDYSAVMAERTYYDTDLDMNGIVRFILSSDLIQAAYGYGGNGCKDGSFSISRYDGERMTGTFDIESYMGDTLSGTFNVPFSPTNDPGFGTDGVEPVAQPSGEGADIGTIANRTITIDGFDSDWQTIDPAITDAVGDNIVDASGVDVTALFLAADESYVYWRLDIADGSYDTTGSWGYRAIFSTGDPYNWNIEGCIGVGVDFFSDHWFAYGFRKTATGTERLIEIEESYGACANIIEMKFPRSILPTETNLLVQGFIQRYIGGIDPDWTVFVSCDLP